MATKSEYKFRNARKLPIDRAKGVMLGLMVGDSLGAAVEGWPPEMVSELAQSLFGETCLIEDFIPAIHMGTVVPLGSEIGYRWADQDNDSNFIRTGPNDQALLQPFLRCGHYSDDTNASIALAESLIDCEGVRGDKIADSFVRSFQRPPLRGYPPTAKAVMKAIAGGMDYRKTGLPPVFPFHGGSFANGGAMRISPLAVLYQHVPANMLRPLCAEAIRSTHCHPEAIDGAVVQCQAIKHMLSLPTCSDFHATTFLDELIATCNTEGMRNRLTDLRARWLLTHGSYEVEPAIEEIREDYSHLQVLIESTRPGSGLGFQIASIDAMGCVIWVVCRYAKFPFKALQSAIGIGGDTDTIASMVGAMMGALHGLDWVPSHLYQNLENGEYGRDYALELMGKLYALRGKSSCRADFPLKPRLLGRALADGKGYCDRRGKHLEHINAMAE